MVKITFTGDIMCEKEILDQYGPQNTPFDTYFTQIKPLLTESDYVIGNLETVFAGEEQGYTNEMYSFNTPDEFLLAIKDLPVHFVTTANNHAIDRGLNGLERTIDILDSHGVGHVGTSKEALVRRMSVIEIEGIKIAILSYTSSVNYGDHKTMLPEEYEDQICLMCPQDFAYTPAGDSLKLKANRFYTRVLGIEGLMKLKKRLRRKHNIPSVDILDPEDLGAVKPYSERIAADIKKANEVADIVVVAPHMGGQFNPEPGAFVEWYMQFFADRGAHLVVGNHPHIIQKTQIIDGLFAFFSLGNFSLSPRSTYVIMDDRPDIGLLLHVYINRDTKVIGRLTISPIQMIHDDSYYVKPLLSNVDSVTKKSYIDWLSEKLQVDLIQSIPGELEVSYP